MWSEYEMPIRFADIPRAEGVSDRVVRLGFAGRFVDELLSGLFDVLMPTFRTQFGLSLAQVGLLPTVLNYVAAVVEPLNGLLIDTWNRRWLLAGGAAFCGLALLAMGLAEGYALLLLGFVLYGVGSGPMAHTADVVLVEAHPEAPSRIYARATSLDTLGALTAPLLVTAGVWLNVDWRWLLVGAGVLGVAYAYLLARTRFPAATGAAPEDEDEPDDGSFLRTARRNIAAVLSSRRALAWLAVLLAYDLIEAPMAFHTVWLHEEVGMSLALIGLYRALEMAVGLEPVLYLDRWLRRTSPRRVLLLASAGLVALFPAWLLVPGVWTRFALGVPLNFLFAMLWPIGKAESLSSVPGRPGTVTAVNSLFGFLPLTLVFGVLSESFGLTPMMLVVHVGALLVLIGVVLALPRIADPLPNPLP